MLPVLRWETPLNGGYVLLLHVLHSALIRKPDEDLSLVHEILIELLFGRVRVVAVHLPSGATGTNLLDLGVGLPDILELILVNCKL